MKQIPYQQKAVTELVNKVIDLLRLHGSRHTLVFKAPTGSGKTVMASQTLMRINEELTERPDAPFTEVAFIWIAPNKLHEQSYFKMKNYFTENCALRPVIFDEIDHSVNGYIKPGEILFVNWESINKDSNLIVRDTENSASLYDITRRTQEDNDIPIVLVIDEEHKMASSSAKKAEGVLNNINAKIEIRISATPDPHRQFKAYYEVPREDVIEAGMIKKNIILNPALDFKKPHGSLNQHLIWLALQKRQELANIYKAKNIDINPLLLIQLPNDSSENLTAEDTKIKEEVITTLNKYGINTTNGKLAIWLSGEKTDNLDVIDRLNDPTEILLFKQAIALGWDCPRAAVLLIFRKIESLQFSAQTVGRILRMPEQTHYTDDRLNYGYVYTNLSEDIIKIVQGDMDYFAKMIKATRREGIKNIVLDSEYRERLPSDRNRLGSDFKEVLKSTFQSQWGISTGRSSLFTENMLFSEDSSNEVVDVMNESYKNRQIAINQHGIDFKVTDISTNIIKDLEMTGEVGSRIVSSKASYINNATDLTAMFLALCKQLIGNDFEQQSIKMLSGVIKEVMDEMFEVTEYDAMKIILSNDSCHNRQKFELLIHKAIQKYTEILHARQSIAKQRAFKRCDWDVPMERAYTLGNHTERSDIEWHALIPYMEYSGPKASAPEQKFATFLDAYSNVIEWWYKNGDQGKDHYAIGYTNSLGEKALFYVDFIIHMKNGAILLFDTKTKLSDREAPFKHNALLEYMKLPKNKTKNLQGGIIIQDKFGNWRYSLKPLDTILGTSDISDWTIFDPNLYL